MTGSPPFTLKQPYRSQRYPVSKKQRERVRVAKGTRGMLCREHTFTATTPGQSTQQMLSMKTPLKQIHT